MYVMPLFSPIAGGAGTPGKSAYEIAVDNGYVGTEAEWLASISGAGAVATHEGVFNHPNFNAAYNHSISPHLQFSGLNRLIVAEQEPPDLVDGDVFISIG
jgi:hypothetical protein